MQFANTSLLLGGLLIAIPVILHLVMRQDPKHFEFPALRFVKQKNIQNQRRLQLKHWILLLLRCGAILLLILALALPSVATSTLSTWLIIALLGFGTLIVGFLAAVSWGQEKNQILAYGLASLTAILLIALLILFPFALSREEGTILGDQEAPVAAVFVIDSSARMQYEHENLTRLQAAQDLAQWLASQLPSESEIAIVDHSTRGIIFAKDIGAAQQAISGLQIEPSGTELTPLVLESLTALEAHELTRKELYVFSDMSLTAWASNNEVRLNSRLQDLPEIAVYVLDQSIDQPMNSAIVDLQLSGESLAKNSDLFLQVEIVQEGQEQSRAVELYLEQQNPALPIVEDGKLILPESSLKNRQSVTLSPETTNVVPLELIGLEEGIHFGWIRLAGSDGLAMDDRRWFCIEVRAPWDLLIVKGQRADPNNLINVLAPPAFRESGRAAFEIDTIDENELSSVEMDLYDAIVLLDPGNLDPNSWQQLDRFVDQGGGLTIFLGRNANLTSMNSEEAQEVLPGKLVRQWRAGDRNWFVAPADYQHQMLSAFREIGAAVPWNEFPIYRHWSMNELAEEASTIVAFNNGLPALIEQSQQRGSVLIFTSSISDSSQLEPWNELLSGFESWPFFVLANSMLRYQVQKSEGKFNYITGERAMIATQANHLEATHLLFTPTSTDLQEVIPEDGIIRIPFTKTLGTYRLRVPGGESALGFAVNLKPGATKLQKIETSDLDRVLGEDRYKVAKNKEEIEREQGEVRVGRKFYPYLLMLAALFFGLEHLLANRFYQTQF